MSYCSSGNTKQDLLMNSLQTFFLNKDNLETLIPIINGDSKISLRVIDWFVTNYSKKNNISYLISDNNEIIENLEDMDGHKYRQFVVYLDYKLQLKGYQKKQFDPFCRRSRIDFYYDTDKFFVTTVGQLNFFKWAITNKILDYIGKNLKIIEHDMNSCYKAVYNLTKTKEKKVKEDTDSEESSSKKSSRRKRHELSISATKTLSKTNVKVIVSFD